MRVLAILVLGSLVATTPAVAADDQPDDKMVCKRVLDTNTGSNFRRKSKECRRASEWKAIEDAKDRTLRTARDNSGMDPNRPQTMSGTPQ